MPATFGIAAVSIAGMARSYAERLSLFPVSPVWREGRDYTMLRSRREAKSAEGANEKEQSH